MRCLLILNVIALMNLAIIASSYGQSLEDRDSAAIRLRWFEQQVDQSLELYQWLHRHPEISLEEIETARKLAELWQSQGMTVTRGVGGTGIVGLLNNGEGPTVMLRTDLDGLPVLEQTGLDYASQNEGVMHACGHDIHMTTVTTVARFLAEHRQLWSGTLMAIGQPAEERGLGARAMLTDGLFKRFPKPDVAIALHVDSFSSPGKVAVSGGFVNANADAVDIVVKGRGGHGSAPHTTIDPIVQAADLIMSLQTIVSREVKPQAAAVVTVGSIHGGTKHNIIGNECRLQLTVRSHSDDVRAQLVSAIKRRAEGIATAYGASAPEVIVSEGVPAMNNDQRIANRLGDLFATLVGSGNVGQRERGMGFEDFSEYGRAGVPIVMYSVGSVSAQRLADQRESGGIASLHSATYYPDARETLETAFVTMSAAALELFSQLSD